MHAQGQVFFIFPSALAAALYALAYMGGAFFLVAYSGVGLSTGMGIAWLCFSLIAIAACAVHDFSRFGFHRSTRCAALGLLEDSAGWQRLCAGGWRNGDCVLRYECYAYLLLEWRNETAAQRWQVVWRDSMSANDWHRLRLYMQLSNND